MRRNPGQARTVFAVASLLVFALALGGCGRPADENWLRVVQFEDEDGTVTSSVSSVLESSTTTTTTTTTSTEEETSTEAVTADHVYVVLVNQSTIPGSDEQAGGVTVDEVRISYRIPGYSPADAVIPVSVYVPATSASDTETAGTRLQLPLVSVGLKSWLVAHVPASVRKQGFSGAAELTLHARTDQGGAIETRSEIGIEFVTVETTTSTTTTTF